MIKVLGDRVLVALPPRESQTTTASGLVLVKDPELRTETRGIVVALGEKSDAVSMEAVLDLVLELEHLGLPDGFQNTSQVLLTKLKPAPFDVAIGDCVLFSPAVGELIDGDDLRYLILHETDIIGVIEPVNEEVA